MSSRLGRESQSRCCVWVCKAKKYSEHAGASNRNMHSSTSSFPHFLPTAPSSHAPEKTGTVAKEEEHEDHETSPADNVLLGHLGLLLHDLHDRVLVQPGAKLGELELESVSHLDKEWAS